MLANQNNKYKVRLFYYKNKTIKNINININKGICR